MNFAGKHAVVIGATGGIGRAVAHELAARGARLTLVGRRPAELEQLVRECERQVTSVVTADLSVDAVQLGQRLATLNQPVDMLVNCAGMQIFGMAHTEAASETARLFAVNVVGPIQMVNALLPNMLARGEGAIVNVGSIFGSIGFPCFASYSASKFALRGYSEALRREIAGSGVNVHYIAPRYTRTSFNGGAVARMADALRMNQDAPERVAKRVIRVLETGQANTYIGWSESFFVRLNALLPSWVDGALIRQGQKMRAFLG